MLGHARRQGHADGDVLLGHRLGRHLGGSGLALALLGVMTAAVTVYLRFVHPMLGFDPYIPPMGYRPLLYLVMLLETLGFLLVGFGLVSEQVAQVRDELEALRKRGP